MNPQDGGLWLRSVVRHGLWPLKERFEACSTSAPALHKQSSAPGVHSQEGIYAFKTIDNALANLDRTCYRGTLLGRVKVWGTTQKHQVGYRAQFAYPHSFTHGICCICKRIVNLKSEHFAIGWAAYHFSDDFSVSGFVCNVCNEKYYSLDTETGYAELSELAERYGIIIG
jgi:hypothetical protein